MYLSRGLNATHNSLKICKANIEGTKTKKLQKDEAKINVDDVVYHLSPIRIKRQKIVLIDSQKLEGENVQKQYFGR